MQIPVLHPRQLHQVFGITASGFAEMSCGVTALSRTSVELLFRLDGIQTLNDVRETMQAVPTPEFASSFGDLCDRGLIQATCEDLFDAQASGQLSLLGLQAARADASSASRMTVGLACRHAPHAGMHDRPLCAVIVEDDPVLSRFLDYFLTLGGFRTRLASNKSEVVVAVRLGAPDLFILDGNLPDVDGFDILRRIRQHPQLAAVPALMMTGRNTRGHILEAFGSGADGYLTKPVDADCLLRSVRAVVGLPQEQAPDIWTKSDSMRSRASRAAA